MSSSILTAFVGSLQASISVLLTISYGVLAAQFRLIGDNTAKDLSKACVRLFLPALLVYNVGSQLQHETATNYVPILIFAIMTILSSVAFGSICTRFFKLPGWITPAIAFNNTTSLPLLLVQSLNAAGVLAMVDDSPDVVERAKSYFLVNAMVSNSLTFAIGPWLLNSQDDDLSDVPKRKRHSHGSTTTNGSSSERSVDIEIGRVRQRQLSANSEDESDDALVDDSEETTLLSDSVARSSEPVGSRMLALWQHYFEKLPRWLQSTLIFTFQLANPPFFGAVAGAIIGLTPTLHRLFFSPPDEGGYFRAWLTTSIKNIGDLFAALQIVVVGVKLWQAMVRVKQGKDSGAVPWRLFVFVTAVRYFVWPVLSILIVWVLAAKTGLLIRDPLLWFCMMLMPTGPPALKLSALADISDVEEHERLSVAKFLTLSYVISPLICFAVVGALKASQAAHGV
ncbi:membrane transporter [Phyllosticta citribraziliensis]|uniref:Membrane transporter n=1 Tax=Phyllosticta citribraziliensis TaxID=989973 RepID=A0ABR1LL71_9PEZI